MQKVAKLKTLKDYGYTKAAKRIIEDGGTMVAGVAGVNDSRLSGQTPVSHQPRHRNDPEPWLCENGYRWSGREIALESAFVVRVEDEKVFFVDVLQGTQELVGLTSHEFAVTDAQFAARRASREHAQAVYTAMGVKYWHAV